MHPTKEFNRTPTLHPLAIMLVASGIAVSPLATFAELPTGGAVVSGQATIQQAGSQLTISQGSAQANLDWQSFSISQGNSVNFIQPSSSALAINRVLGENTSTIAGSLTANGRVVLINPNGVLFTPTSLVNVGSLIASTLKNIAQGNSANTLELSGDSIASVINQGHITAAQGGSIALIAAEVKNLGTITAPGGHVALAAGKKVRLDIGGPLNLEIEEGAFNAYIEQGGVIQAQGGKIFITAKTLNEMVHTVMNHTGVTEAQTAVTGEKGEIILLGDMRVGRAEVSGRLDAGAPNGGDGGFIETSAAYVDIKSNTTITARSNGGSPGTWLIDPFDYVIDQVAADVISGALSDGTSVTIDTNVSPTLIGSNPISGAPEGSGDITLQGSIFYSPETHEGVTVTSTPALTFLAGRHIVFSSNGGTPSSLAGVYSYSSPLNVNLFSNQLGGGGAIVLEPGTAIYSGGGNIVLSGGTNPASGFATGFENRPHGVEIMSATLDATSYLSGGPGSISVRGKSIQGSPGDGVRIMGGQLRANGSISIDGMSRATLSNPIDQAAGVRLGCDALSCSSLSSGFSSMSDTPSRIQIVGDAEDVIGGSTASNKVAGIVLEGLPPSGSSSFGQGSSLIAGGQGGELLLEGIAPASGGYAVRLGPFTDIYGSNIALVGVGGGPAAIQIDDFSYISAYFFLAAGKSLATQAAANISAREIYFDVIGRAEISSGIGFSHSDEDPSYLLIRAGEIDFKPSWLGLDFLGLLSSGPIVINPVDEPSNLGSMAMEPPPNPAAQPAYLLKDTALIKGANVTLNHPISAANMIDVVALTSFTNNVGSTVFSTAPEGSSAGTWRLWLPDPTAIGPSASGLAPSFIHYNRSFDVNVEGLPASIPETATSSLFEFFEPGPTYTPPDTEPPGNGIFYSAKPTLTVSLVGTTSKVYDGNLTIDVAPSINIGSVSGALGADNIDLVTTFGSSQLLGTLASKDVGEGILSSLASSELSRPVVATTTTINGPIPVFGYQLASVSGPIGTITPRPIIVTTDSGQTKVFGEADPILTFTLEANSSGRGLVGSDTFSGALGRDTGENVGSAYAINQGTLANSNYAITFTGANFAITPRPIMITANSGQTKVYGEADSTLTFTPEANSPGRGIVGTDTFSGALARAAGESVGSAYAISQGTLANSNYTITFTGANFAITPRPITITADSGQAKVYGEADPTLTFTPEANSPGRGLVGSDAFNGALSRVPGESVGSAYAINQGNLANSNYVISFVSADFAIDLRSLTITGITATQNVTADGAIEVTFSTKNAKFNGLVQSDQVVIESISGEFSLSELESATQIPVQITLAGSDLLNYSLVQPVFAVITREQPISPETTNTITTQINAAVNNSLTTSPTTATTNTSLNTNTNTSGSTSNTASGGNDNTNTNANNNAPTETAAATQTDPSNSPATPPAGTNTTQSPSQNQSTSPPPDSPVASEKPQTPKDSEDSQDQTLASLEEPEQPKEAENAQRSNETEVTVSPGLITVRVPMPPRPQGQDATGQRFSFQGNSSRW